MRKLFEAICGPSTESASLRKLCVDFYRGKKDERLREWSGADQHFEQVYCNYCVS